jgi:hypothetical protein
MLSLVFLSLPTYLYRITYFLCYTKPATETFALLPAELGTNIFLTSDTVSDSPIVRVLNQISDSLIVYSLAGPKIDIPVVRQHKRKCG